MVNLKRYFEIWKNPFVARSRREALPVLVDCFCVGAFLLLLIEKLWIPESWGWIQVFAPLWIPVAAHLLVALPLVLIWWRFGGPRLFKFIHNHPLVYNSGFYPDPDDDYEDSSECCCGCCECEICGGEEGCHEDR